jgi:hypothetical protein
MQRHYDEWGGNAGVPGLGTRCVRTSSSPMDWVFEPPPIETPLRAAIRDWHRLDEIEADARIAAVVGAQPFGGERLSGTGPKAGGPRYLHRFATERTVSIDTTAAGGNASLLSLGES